MAFGSTKEQMPLPPSLRRTRRLRCRGCKPHAFQDKRYGRGVRVHNRSKQKGWICTVCGNARQR